MPYAIEQSERISQAIPRIVTELLDIAQAQLLDEKEPSAERIHNARKRFKESRAVVRLVRFSLDCFETENAWFRDAGRDLAALRDADALVEAVDSLALIAEGYHERRVLRRLRRRLLNAQRRATADDLGGRIESTVQQLAIARARVSAWPVSNDDFETIGEGLRRTYRDGRRALKTALGKPGPEAFHDFRKRVKDHWYHAQLLRHVWPEFMKSYRDQMEELSDLLGDRHDLDVLGESIVAGNRFGTAFEIEVLNKVIDERVADLSTRAMEIARRIYAESPDAIHDRLKRYWEVWRAAEDA